MTTKQQKQMTTAKVKRQKVNSVDFYAFLYEYFNKKRGAIDPWPNIGMDFALQFGVMDDIELVSLRNNALRLEHIIKTYVK